MALGVAPRKPPRTPELSPPVLQRVLRTKLVALAKDIGKISGRKRADGTTAFTAQIRLLKQGDIVHTVAQTFMKKALAPSRMKRGEAVPEEPRANAFVPKAALFVPYLNLGQSKEIPFWWRGQGAQGFVFHCVLNSNSSFSH